MSRRGENRVVAVTGASRGIGRASAGYLAQAGYRVFALARSEEDLRVLSAEAARRGQRIEPIRLDIADDESRQSAVAAIMQATDGYGVDALVNNAGFGQFGPLEEIPTEKFRQQLEVNVVGLLAMTQPFLPAMRARRCGTVVNISSAAGRVATPFMGAYNASKFAVEGLSDALRLELSPFGVRVVLIAPGPIRSSFGEAADALSQEDPMSPYAPFIERWRQMRRTTDRFERSAETVGRVVVRAISAERPRPRYTITLPARMGAVTRRLVPDVVSDWILRQALGLGD
ncbi:MAG: SDR family oxidoreductase [Chloroflexota bacterium]|nr:SDR family oxidoreductase [Chloroflexota bacterium]